ncbi:MAG: hypothetical protein A2X25_09250 [Chloroflexi bacterium GWB2_49_20]|nr:MAG: hypothetical protein A2X25_09250 [Chloroflexi bacterium GWB2_49_20]OGN79387.1 MAG: hypothetical protein A2X26_04775 [Chloroflexi bacterium GWC2_49_37]OGN82843.1 MAG: hypothetical protein A2X27_07920 [Chloroflexi bacterium GWD2_49_16]HCC78493.1 hypothetical protein [Anaerolineae bacterium]HCM97318.1 hypothetical protein [Anaerolineae bacterium]
MTIFLKIWVNEEDYMTDQTEIILKGRLKGYQRMRLIKLLDMEYTPGELAIEVGFNRRQVYRVYMHQGCPHRRDNKRRLWINGKEFQEWYEFFYPRIELGKNEAFCLTCKKPVIMNNPHLIKKGGFIYWICKCPNCGRKLPRIIENKKWGK